MPVRLKPCSPDISIIPPSPPDLPPFAESAPPTAVCCVLSTVIRPPLPCPVALADTRAPLAITVRAEVPAGAAPDPVAGASVVPIATVPPPARPFALMWAEAAIVLVLLPATITWPPVVPGARPSADRRPSTTTEPPVPATSMRPAWLPTEFAWIFPPARTSVWTTPSAAEAVSCTTPPSARIVPVLVTRAVTARPSVPVGTLVTCLVTSMLTSPSPYMSSVWAAAPARITWPSLALITPELATEGATSAASPACLTVMVPLLTIRAFGLAAWSKAILPAMKFWLVIPAALTTTDCALTSDPR